MTSQAKSLKPWQLALMAMIIGGYPLIAVLPPIFRLENSRDVTVAFRAIALIYYIAVGYQLSIQKRFSFGLFGTAFVVFWLLYSARILFETTQRPETLVREPYEYYLYPFFVTLIPSIFSYSRYTIQEALIAGKLLLYILIADGIAISLTYFTVSVVTLAESERAQFALSTINPITVGHLGLTLGLMAVAMFTKIPASYRVWIGWAGVLGFWLLIASASRGALVSFAVVAGVFWATKIRRSIKNKFVMEATMMMVVAAILIVAPIWLAGYVEDTEGFSTKSRVEMIGTEDDLAGNMRMMSFEGAWNQFLESPFLGDALEEKTTGFYPHNNVLEAFMTTGFLGGALMVFLYVVSFVNAVKLIASETTYTWIGLVLLQYLVATQFSGAIWWSDALFCLMALANGAVHVLRR